MPKVPYLDNVVPLRPQEPQVDQTYLAMAAAIMHEQGRLFERPIATESKVEDGNPE